MAPVLVADIGGTNARFALVDEHGIHDPTILKVTDYDGPASAGAAYLSARGVRPERAIFAVAGPITGGDRFELTNFPWVFSVETVRAELKLNRLELINDFHAVALALPVAEKETIAQIGGGTAEPQGNIGIIGPGTGLGVASLVWDGARHIVLPGEGGHVSLPTKNAREAAIAGWLLAHKYSHVSAERVCSGKGLLNLYDAIRGLDGVRLPDRSPEEITSAAIADACDVCKECLALMLGFLGRVAGNLALTNNTAGGIYFVGGILPKIGIAYLRASHLRGEFIAKGRQTAFVERIPTFLVDDPYLALRGLRARALDPA